MLEDLLKVVARALVDHPDQVEVSQSQGENGVVLELRVAPEDLGKVIGKQGRIARAIRSVVKAQAGREGKRVVVEIS